MAKRNDPLNQFRMALAAKRGDIPADSLRGAAKHLYETCSEEQLSVYAKKPETKQRAHMFTRAKLRRAIS